MLLDLEFSVKCFVDHCLSHCHFSLTSALSLLWYLQTFLSLSLTYTHTHKHTHKYTFLYILVGWFMVLNATFINISVVSWRRKPEYRENTAHLPQVTDNLYHIMLYASPWIYIYFTFITFFDICRKITTIWSYIYIRNMISNKGR